MHHCIQTPKYFEKANRRLHKTNDSIRDFLESTGRDYKNADKIVGVFADKLIEAKFNAALGQDFITILQLLNDEFIINQYNLSDIGKLFTSLFKLQEYNLDLYVDAANFQWTVMDDADKAKPIIHDGIEKGKQKVEELKKLLDEINAE